METNDKNKRERHEEEGTLDVIINNTIIIRSVKYQNHDYSTFSCLY